MTCSMGQNTHIFCTSHTDHKECLTWLIRRNKQTAEEKLCTVFDYFKHFQYGVQVLI
uniref:Uncharacterized protein n=1 Tax=Arion vulgaris TaxID=1028688 RepID=A0A0B7A1B9_9EUPU